MRRLCKVLLILLLLLPLAALAEQGEEVSLANGGIAENAVPEISVTLTACSALPLRSCA